MISPDDGDDITGPSLPAAGPESRPSGWAWPINLSRCDRSAVTAVEVAALRGLGSQVRRPPGHDQRSLAWRRVRRLVEPLDLARDVLHMSREGAPGRRQRRAADDAIGMILWLYIVCYAYLLTGFIDFHRLARLRGLALARRVFGPAEVEAAIEPIRTVLTGWGHQMDQQAGTTVDTAVSLMLLVNRSPRLADLDEAVVIALRETPRRQAQDTW